MMRLCASRARSLPKIWLSPAFRSEVEQPGSASNGSRQSSRWQMEAIGLRRPFSTIDAAQSQIDEVNELFAEARDIIEDARDEAETVYFNDAHAEAKDAVSQCLAKFDGIMGSLSPDERGKLQRSMGLKIEQLKAELEELDELHA